MERVYKSVTDRQRIWSIVIKRGKYDRQHTEYWSDDCGCYHLRTSRGDDIKWVRR